MSRGQNPLIWMMALSLPSAGHALGLGEIHVDSALNEPLAAEIDIVGATSEELVGITASVANRDTFLRFGAERHNFLQSTTFKVTQDAHGRPVLAIRSSESFTEPLVDLVVDLRWRNGELIRQYTLLLDPAGFPSAAHAAQPLATPAGRNPVVAPLVSAPRAEPAARNAPVIAASAAPSAAAVEQPASSLGSPERKTIKVGAKATLRGIAWRAGARSRPDINRLMLAIFRANPSAFDANINRMHLGALLTIPSADEVATIPQAEANREIRSQMSSWLSTYKGTSLASTHRVTVPVETAPAAAAPSASVSHTPAALAGTIAPQTTSSTQPVAQAVAPAAQSVAPAQPVTAGNAAKTVDDMNNAELSERIKQLENNLREVQAQLDAEHSKMLNMQSQVRYAEQQHPAPAKEAAPASTSGRGYLGALIAGVAVLLGALGAFILRSRRTPPPRPNIPLEPMPESLMEPVAPQKHTYGAAPVAAPRQVAAPVAAVAAATPAPIQSRAIDDSLLELSQLEPTGDLSSELGMAQPPQEDASTADTAEVDTRGVDAARKRDDAVASRMREELEAAWSIPAAEDYQRFDDTEMNLAEAIEKSLADTARLRATEFSPEGASDTAETSKNQTVHSSPTEVGSVDETVLMDVETTRLPAATLAMHAAEIARAFEEPTVQQPRPDPNQLDYNLLDLDQDNALADSLHDHVVVKDNQASPIETLKHDLQREVLRDDVRLKALETYVTQAAAGREYAQVIDELTQVRELLSEAEWNKANELVKQSADRSGDLADFAA